MLLAYYALFVLDAYAARWAMNSGEYGEGIMLAMLGLFFGMLAIDEKAKRRGV